MKLHITIFNYQREDMLDNTISEIERFRDTQNNLSIDYIILDDESSYTRPNMHKFKHSGKPGFWEKWNFVLNRLKDTKYDMYLFIPNDFSNYDFESIINYHNTFDEPYVFNLANDGREMCWNTIKPIQYDNYKQVFFTDCGFFCNYSVLELLEFKINPIDKSRFTYYKNISSGVGEQLTHRLNKLNVKMYTPNYSFVFHGQHPSTMHQLERNNNPLITIGRDKQEEKKEMIVVGIATMNSRKKTLNQVIQRLKDQTLKPDKIFIYNNDENKFNATDNGKFYPLTILEEDCIFLSMDDDILYPVTYIEDMVKAVKEHNCIVTHHGRKLNGINVPYYTGHKSYSCLRENNIQDYIDVAGTGVTAFRTSYFNSKELFYSEYKRMSDVVFSLAVAQENKQILLLKHNVGYLKDICEDVTNSCFVNESKNQDNQIKLCNEIYIIKTSK